MVIMRKWVIFQSASSADHDGHFLEGFFNFQHPLKGSWRWKIAQMQSHLAKLASLWCIFSEKKFPETLNKKIEAQYMP